MYGHRTRIVNTTSAYGEIKKKKTLYYVLLNFDGLKASERTTAAVDWNITLRVENKNHSFTLQRLRTATK